MVIRRTLRASWYLGALLIVLLALAMVAGRILFPLLEAYPATVERMVQEQTGHRLEIGRMDFGWSALGPEMRLHKVRLWMEEGPRPLLSIEQLAIGLDLFGTLAKRRVVTRRIRLEGTSLTLVRNLDGRLHLEGAPHATSNFLALLLDQPRLQARRVRLRFRDARHLPEGILLEVLSIDLRREGDRRQLWFEARPGQGLGRKVEGGFDLAGWQEGRDSLHGVWYLRAASLGLDALEKRIRPNAEWQVAGVADFALWGNLEAGRVREVTGRAALHLPSLQKRGDALPIFVAGSLDSLFRWSRTEDGQRLDVASLRIQEASQPYWETGASLRLDPVSEGWRVRLALDRVDTRFLAGAGRVLSSRLPTRFRPLLDMRGRLEDLRMDLKWSSLQGVRDLRMATRFHVARFPGRAPLPGMEHLSGSLRYGEGRGELVLDSEQVVVEMPSLFRDRLSFSRLAGRLRWQQGNENWRARIENFLVDSRDVGIEGGGWLYAARGRRTPEAEIDLAIGHGRVAAVPRYLPARIMSPRAVHWLDRALVDGRITTGHLRLRGNLGDIPFDRGSGRLDILAHVEDGVLDYHPQWHRIEDIRADVRFINGRMQIDSPHARILDVDLENVSVGIRDLRRTPLTATGRAQGAFNSMLRYVRESPLAARGYHVERLRGGGEAALELSLTVPLRREHGERVRVAGKLQLEHDRLDIEGYPVALEGIGGTVHFTDEGIEGKGLTAHLWKAPVRLDIATLEDAAVTRVELNGPIPFVARLQETDFPLRSRFRGESEWHARLDIGRGAAGMQITLASDLKGIEARLPAPAGKRGDQRRGFRLTTHIDEKGTGPLRLVYGKHSAVVELAHENGYRIRRASILFGAPAARLPEHPGLWIAGELDTLPLDDWRALLRETSGTGGLALPPPEKVDVTIRELGFLHVPWRKVHLQVKRDDQLWRLGVTCDRVEGQATFGLPLNATGLRMDLKRLDLPSLKGKMTGESERIKPDALPPLSIHAERFAYEGTEWGRLDLITRPLSSSGLKVESATLESKWLHAEAKGSWMREAEQEFSRFRVKVHNTDLGRLLERAGYGEQLDGGLTDAELEANWPGPPWAFDLARIEGSLSITILDGRILRLKPGAGRLLGLLNLQAIPRRLTLDFSDLFKKGFVFDRLEGHFTFVDGDAYTTDLVIEAPSARIEIAGRTGLAARDYDELVTVTPHIRSGLPIAGAIAGGPAVGAALLLADRLLGEKLDRIGRVQYTVTGPWESPNFKRLGSGEK